jgi:subtilisin family serine protease
LSLLNQPCDLNSLTGKFGGDIPELILEAWSKLQKREPIKVGIIDTGIDFHHPVLKKFIKPGIDLVDAKPSIPMDENGHGTHAAGTICMLGLLPGVELYSIKMLGRHMEGDFSRVIPALQWAIDNRIDLINMSFAYREDNPAIYKAIQMANDAGIIMVASTGNRSNWDDPPKGMTKKEWEKIVAATRLPRYSIMYPARYSEVIAVAHCTPQGKISSRANIGPELDLAAPGTNIISTNIGGRFGALSGTSMAAPHVTAAIVLMLALDPNLSPAQVKVILKNTTRNKILDLAAALKQTQDVLISEVIGETEKSS